MLLCKLLIFADDLNIFRVINSPHDCLLLQSDINSMSDWYIANYKRLNTAKTRVVSYTRKTFFFNYSYQLCRATITRASSIKDLGVFFDSKLYFHNHVDYVLSESIKLLGLIHSITYSVSSLECLYVLYFTLVESKLECASVEWNSITSTDTSKLERIQQKFMSICCYRFSPHVPYNYTAALEKLGLHSLCKKRYYFDAHFLIQVYHDLKSCTILLVPPSNLRESLLFCACPSDKHCPSARCAYVANVAVGKDLDIFALGTVSLNCIYAPNSR
jgi:hypothetical protein